MTALPEPQLIDPVEVVIELRERGLLDDSTSDGRFARRLVGASVQALANVSVRHFAWQVCARHADLVVEIGVSTATLDGEQAPVGWTVADVQTALGVAAKAAERPRTTDADPWLPEPLPPKTPRERLRQVALGDDGRLALSSPFEAKDRLKLIRGRQWDPTRNVWFAPIAEWQQVVLFAEQYSMDISPHARAAIDQAEAAGVGADDEFKYHLFVNDAQTHVVYRAGYVEPVVEAFKALEHSKGHKVKKTGQYEWWVPAEDADKVDEIARMYGLLPHPAVEPILKRWVKEAEEMRALSRALDSDFEVPRITRPLFGFQRAAVQYAQRAGFRCFLADEPGVGKTASAIGACELYDQWPIIVVCPTAVEVAWRREIDAVTPHRKVINLQGRGAREFQVADYIIIGWPNLSFWIEQLLKIQPKGVVFDESQLAKDDKTQRTRAAKATVGVGTRALTRKQILEMPGAPVPDLGLRLNLTGTDVLNNTGELFPQLALLGRLEEMGGQKALKDRYVKMADVTSQAGMEERLAELHDRLRSRCYLRRRKKDVDKDLPEKLRTFLWVEPDPTVMGEYREAEANLAEYLRRVAHEQALKLGVDADSAAAIAAVRAGGANHLVMINVLRQLAAKAKLPAAKDWAQAFLEGTDESLLIYAHHRPIVEAMAAACGATKIMGGQTQTQRQNVIDRFQAKQDRTCVLSIKAAGVGITLTAANTGLFIEQAWNPPTLVQAEDRMHRRGQTNQVTASYMVCEDLIDVDIIELLEEKRVVTDLVTDGEQIDTWDPAETDDPEKVFSSKGSIAGDLIERLTRRALAAA